MGEEFGKTIESLFMDSFEVPIYRNGIYWNADLLAEFKQRKGYDLEPFSPPCGGKWMTSHPKSVTT